MKEIYQTSFLCVFLKLKNPEKTLQYCNQSLKIEVTYKPLFRRGQAYLLINELELAKKDFESALQLENNNEIVETLNYTNELFF